MLNTVFSYKNGSFELTYKERYLLMLLLNFFKYEIPEGNGSYISMLNLNKVDFVWSPKMALNEDGVFGAWMFTFPNTVFIRPSDENSEFIEYCKNAKSLSKNEQEIANSVIHRHVNEYQLFKGLNLDMDLLRFIFYMIENQGTLLSTVFHELYHKWQFNSAKLLYIVNSIVFTFIGYDLSTKSKWSIEGDVRIKVDNDALHGVIDEFSKIFYQYIYCRSQLANYPDNEYAINTLMTMKKENYLMYDFAEKLFIKIQVNK